MLKLVEMETLDHATHKTESMAVVARAISDVCEGGKPDVDVRDFTNAGARLITQIAEGV